jgi:hypothetical protein
MHLEPHFHSGKYFRINLSGGEAQSVYDQTLEGSLVRLKDWADRIEQDSSLSKRDIELALMFYAHRCLPNLPPSDGVSPSSMDLTELVYGIRFFDRDGQRGEELVVLRENELQPDN